MRWVALVLGAILLWFLGVAGWLIVAGLRDEVRAVDVIVVPGNHVHADGRPSERLRERLDRALALYREGLAPAIIVSGGISSSGVAEAPAMRAYLVAGGVPESAVSEDPGGVNTAATAAFAADWLAARGGRSALVVSQYFHLMRCRLALRRVGVYEVAQAAAGGFAPRDLWSVPREVLALHALWLGIERDMPI